MLRGIRGATTVKANSAAVILAATKELLSRIVKTNKVKTEDIAAVIFSATRDLNAEFPAKAARRMGWTDVPLLCTYEIAVPGSIKKCIRILMFVNTGKSQKEIKHIYLNGTKVLRTETE